jgi:DNA-binding winged helix-turn-helix (wHTH) protein/TolB-like protein/Tfp pilus assembly protein PilF
LRLPREPRVSASTESPRAPWGTALQIGEWTVEPTLNRLTSEGRDVKLEPKSMAVLLYLARHHGEVASREALLAAVWSGTVVGDDSLTQVVLKLRKALGDVREKPAYIQTISKAGYRLIAPVVKPESISDAAAAALPAPRLHGKRSLYWLIVAGMTTLMLAGYWWMEHDRGSVATRDSMRFSNIDAQRASQPTLTVAPFVALGDDPQAALLAAGMTADLATDLSKVSGLSIIAPVRAASGDAGADMRLDPAPARYVVSGSVQRMDERLRVHVYLTDAQTGKQLWSERFDRALAAFFTVQEELGPKILQIIPTKVSETELRRVAQRHTRNLEAYEYFQRGQEALRARQKEDNDVARELFRRAIGLDATFARAYAGLARTYAADYRQHWTTDDDAALDRAFDFARTAYQMDPDNPETDWVLAYVYMQRREHKQAMQHLETVVRNYPSFADGYGLMGAVETHLGHPQRGIALVRTALRLNPEASILYFVTLGRAYFFVGDLEQSRINLEQALLRSPLHFEARVYMAALQALIGDKPAALWEAEEIRALEPAFSSQRWLESYPMTDAAQTRKLGQALQQAGL